MPTSDAVELSVDAAWFIAQEIGAGTFPWVLAITPPYRDAADLATFAARQREELTSLGVMIDGTINRDVQQWIQIACWPQRWLELRFVRAPASPPELLRGIVVRRGGQTVVGLRNEQLITFTAVDVESGRDLSAVVTAPLSGRAPAGFDEFSLPVQVGARADSRLRDGEELASVLDHLGIPASARPVVRSVFEDPRRYVEIVAGQHSGCGPQSTAVGVAVIDSAAGRMVVSPTRGFDGQWISVFAPGTDMAIALAIERLTAGLDDGRWFEPIQAVRTFTVETNRKENRLDDRRHC
ncbi:ESX secretion-associated protein EspG [Mycolicibacterium helvum]|uniref:ESX-3 secretion-associated protein EspG3 n=1 Tax=Mycolicibacterium helvum TaxID=1534349 RepID=A0A7I7T9V9_9MYCO|nr:ESX secretion-associated protein EspG [Mycolicibacterium helvum]BBY65583.1 ESX-3 secretion-associated protein EspG3 [Mycolicibacterium helvum]